MGKIVGIWNKLSGAWIKLSKVKKISFIIVLCSLIAAISVYSLSGNKKAEYVPLFTNLDIKDASQMVEKLDQRKYSDYKIAKNGTALLVPETDVDRLRLDLAIDGALPDSGEGFELFDKSNYAMTDADREILYQRALEGELQDSSGFIRRIHFHERAETGQCIHYTDFKAGQGSGPGTNQGNHIAGIRCSKKSSGGKCPGGGLQCTFAQ